MSLPWVLLFAALGSTVGAVAWSFGVPDRAPPFGSVWPIAVGTGVLSAALALASLSVVRAALVAPFDAVIAVCAIIDVRSRTIPNRLTYPTFVAYGIALPGVGVA